MRQIEASAITQAVESLYIQANYRLSEDMEVAIHRAATAESRPLARDIFEKMQENLRLAQSRDIPICQDTGMALIFAELGQEAHIVGGLLEDAVNAGLAAACEKGYLRASVVADPLRRQNTGNNAPGVLHIRLVAGDALRLTVMPKGFGSENMSALRMLNPSVSPEDVVAAVADAVARAGSNPCPPVVVGVGLGGTADMAALLAKRALLRPVGQPHPDPFYAALEARILAAVNALDIGAQGFGGDITALGAAIETYPTHIAGLPLAVCIGCHVSRHAEIVL